MRFIVRNKYHFAGLFLVLVLFIISVNVRKENFSVPLSRHHEWITAHTLMTCEIWDQKGGPQTYGFNPVYSYPGKGNFRRTMLGGVVNDKGEAFYVSYPPFAFLLAYYSTHLIGEPNTDSIRTLSLAIHFLCSVFIYLIAVALMSEKRKHQFSIAGVTGAFLYLLSTGNLWMHGNLYFADMVVQLFVISGIYFIIRFGRRQYKNQRIMLSILFCIFFLATYTEWLGLFLSFYSGLAFLVFYFIRKESRFLKAFLVAGIGSALAITLTFLQYSSIAGTEKLKKVLTSKYEERSGQLSAEETPNQFNIESEEAYDFMIGSIDSFYKMAENFIGIFAIIFAVVLIIPNARRRIENIKPAVFVLALVAISVLTHYYVFFNFNALHDFSSLKAGFLFIILILVFISLIESAISIQLRVLLFVLILGLGIDKGIDSVNRYHSTFPISEVDWNRIATGDAIRKHASPDAAVFLNIPCNPELTYAAKHNLFPIKDTSGLLQTMKNFENTEGQYYHHQGTELEYILEFRVEGEKLNFYSRTSIDVGDPGSGRVYQK